jgi:hypothetical protein
MENGKGLTFSALRAANAARLPEFKNKRGEPAHAKPDGSDWCPAQWFQAFLGEVGEFAGLRVAYEAGEITWDEYRREATKELADIQTYLDLMALRALDEVLATEKPLPAQQLMKAMAPLGQLANERKKYERGDWTRKEYNTLAITLMAQTNAAMIKYQVTAWEERRFITVNPHPSGVELGGATTAKFNEVSERVKSSVRLGGEEGPCVYEARDEPGTYGRDAPQRAWCKTHGFDCPNAQAKA